MYQLKFANLDLPKDEAPQTAPAFSVLQHYPEVSSDTLCRHAKLLGCAGEVLVDSVLMRLGLTSLTLPDVYPIDRIIVHPQRLVGVQIKTTHRVGSDGAYSVTAAHGYARSPAGVRRYSEQAYDLLAVVALPDNVVLFTADKGLTHRIAVSEIATLRRRPGASLDRAFAELGLAPISSAHCTLHDVPSSGGEV